MGSPSKYNGPSKSQGGYFRADANLQPVAGDGGDRMFQKATSKATANKNPLYPRNTNSVKKQGSLGKQGRFGK